MISSEVQRTLVKSPPELWAEISDPQSLARHLGEFGEIRITRVHPEQKVEWEAADASGAVLIKPSGWGTKVVLSVTRELGETMVPSEDRLDAPEVAEDAPEALEQDAACAEQTTLATTLAVGPPPEPEPALEQDQALEQAPSALPEAELHVEDEPAHAPEPKRRRGFFARLFGRRQAPTAAVTVQPEESPAEHEPAHAPEEGPDLQGAGPSAEIAMEPEGNVAPGPSVTEPPAELAEGKASAEIAEELSEAEEVATGEITAVLTGVLDRLGAAHHRPFSRA